MLEGLTNYQLSELRNILDIPPHSAEVAKQLFIHHVEKIIID